MLSDPNRPSKQIQLMVAEYFGLTRTQLLSVRRVKSITQPRMIAMALCRFLTDMSYPAIGQAFGGLDHSTVIHGVRKIRRLLDAGDPEVTRAILYVRERYNGLPAPRLDVEEGAFVRHCVATGIREPPAMAIPKKQCPECPWSKESPPGLFAPERFATLLSTENPAGPMFACHKSVEGKDLPCAGWLEYQRGPNGHNLRVRLAIAKNRSYHPPDLLGEQFTSYEDMAAAHIAAWHRKEPQMSHKHIEAEDYSRLFFAFKAARERNRQIIPKLDAILPVVGKAIAQEGEILDNLVLAFGESIRDGFELVRSIVAERYGDEYAADLWERFFRKEGADAP